MKIDWVKIKGYKSIKDIKVDLNQINVLIGGNGFGKTNFISAFELLRNIYCQQLQNYVVSHGGANALLYLGKKVTDSIILDVCFNNDGNKNRYVIELKESQDNLIIQNSYTSFFSNSWHDQICDKNVLEASICNDRSGQAWYVGPLLDNFDVYHFHDTGMKSPIKGLKRIDENRKLYSDGSNLASFLYYLKQKHLNSYLLIEKMVASIAPSFRCFYLEPNMLNPEMIRLEWKHTIGGDSIFSDWQLSDGTLRFICLATLLLQPNLPSIIIIDEPELGLHPQAINMLSSLIKKASSKSQIIISTQSVGLVDNFELDDILVVNSSNGDSDYVRLDGATYANWLNDYSVGEMWEMNLVGGQPF